MVELKTKKRRPNLSLEYTVKRIAQIVASVPMHDGPLVKNEPPYLKENGGYQLDRGNDWFLHPDDYREGGPEDDEFRYWRLSYRYTTPERQKALEGLAIFLEWELGDV